MGVRQIPAKEGAVRGWEEEAPVVAVMGRVGQSTQGLYGRRTSAVWVHNWGFTTPDEREWFCRMVLCRVKAGGTVNFVGWDGSIAASAV